MERRDALRALGLLLTSSWRDAARAVSTVIGTGSPDLDTGTIATVLGNGTRGDGPETDPLQCRLSRPHGVFADADGAVYVGDSEAHRIRVLR